MGSFPLYKGTDLSSESWDGKSLSGVVAQERSLNSVSLEITHTQGSAWSLILTFPLLWEEHCVSCKNKHHQTKLLTSVLRKTWAYWFQFLAMGIAPFQAILHSPAFQYKHTTQTRRKCRPVGFLTAPIITPPHSHLSRLAQRPTILIGVSE